MSSNPNNSLMAFDWQIKSQHPFITVYNKFFLCMKIENQNLVQYPFKSSCTVHAYYSP